jgi:hypothetical protein
MTIQTILCPDDTPLIVIIIINLDGQEKFTIYKTVGLGERGVSHRGVSARRVHK